MVQGSVLTSNMITPTCRSFYAAPRHLFTTGAIGHVKQRRKGTVPFVLIMTFVAVLVGLVVALDLGLGG